MATATAGTATAGGEAHDVEARLRRAVAEFFEVDEGQVGPSFSLLGRRGQGSIARASLDAALRRRVGVASPLVYSARTYGELAAGLAPGSVVAPAAGAAPAADVPAVRHEAATEAEAGAVRCGVDIEAIANLPEAADCWEDPFYREHFAPSEIAYCLLQESPPHHFAARWCAKEALRKCDGAFLAVPLKDIAVANEGSGAPYLVHHAGGRARRLPHAVSLSHAGEAAVAVVVRVGPPATPATIPAPVAVEVPAAASRGRRGGWLPGILALAALAVSVAALLRTFGIPG
jgi:phosphopantetheine--protein transferase-like protein